MKASCSQYANNRVSGKFQSDEQRITILDAAEKLFLEAGIDKTTMIHIAERVGINRVTLYRYFANRDEVAVEVFIRMMKRSVQLGQYDPQDHSLEAFRRSIQNSIRNFPLLIDRYRFSGMFDMIYLDNPPDSALTQWTYSQLTSAGFIPPSLKEGHEMGLFSEEINLIVNNVVWFLEKLALRGELTWANKEVALEEHLRIFEEMTTGYIDRLIETRDKQKNQAIRPPEQHANGPDLKAR